MTQATGVPCDQCVSIILPTYNEEAVIGEVLEGLLDLPLNTEIIVIDDGSQDGTREVVAGYKAVRLLTHPYNIGNGAAIKTGIRAAQGDILLMMDADGQHQPEDVPRLVKGVVEGYYDMVVGARTPRSDTARHRDFANAIYNMLAGYIAGAKIEDLTSGFRAIRGDVARGFVNLLPNGFSYPTTLTLAAFRGGYSVKYEPIVALKRIGDSKIRLIRDGVGFLLVILRIGTLFAPLRVFLPVALSLLALGVGYGSYLLIFQHRFSNMPVLLILTGVMLFVQALISEQIAMLRLLEVNTQRGRNNS